MSAHGWLTPDDIPASTRCRRLLIPDNLDIVIAVNGALLSLTELHNWEQHGAITPDEITLAMKVMYTKYSYGAWCMIGAVIPCVNGAVPVGTLLCDGSTYDRVDYPDLYAVLDSNWVIDGDTFRVPDLRGRTVIGTGTGSGLSPRDMGDALGEEGHVLTENELAEHTHIDTGHSHPVKATAGLALAPGEEPVLVPDPIAFLFTDSAQANLDSTGEDEPHNTIQPSLALMYVIIAL